ncbi:hypothetical protein [Chondromyces apiculatus]|nr:hypothetical protein [Chondromyces apiculatus]
MAGPTLLIPRPGVSGEMQVLFNRNGVAHEVAPSFPLLAPAPPRSAAAPPVLPPPGPAPPAAPPPPPPERATWPACTTAGRFMYCMDLQGDLRRSAIAGGEVKTIAAGRKGAGIAAAVLPEDHTVVAFLGDRKTTEGVVTQAFVVLDDGGAIPLSEEGAGATFVTMVPWKQGALAMYIDARAALTPVHARTLHRSAQGKLELGPDAVIFVGGGYESRMMGAVAHGAGGEAFALIPTSHSMSGFGMATVRIDDPPRVDAHVTWSMYPNGLSPAPVAALRGPGPTRVARARPASREPGAKAVLELGRLREDGTFAPQCIAAEAASFTHLALEPDRDGTVWLAYTTGEGTWVEHRGGVTARSGGPGRRTP